MVLDNRHILITGATSGIGLGMLEHYSREGWTVTVVNRRREEALERRFPGARFVHFDVRDVDASRKLFAEADRTGQLPSVLFLSAGINKVDNAGGNFSLEAFREVVDVDLMGVMSFVAAALPHFAGRKAVFVAASSTTNIFPNPNCLGYYASKLILHRLFRLLDRVHGTAGVRFKSLVLGPIATNIFTSAQLASRLQSKVRELITVTVEESVPRIAGFVESRRAVLYYPKMVCALFCALRIVDAIVPGLYKGSKPVESGR